MTEPFDAVLAEAERGTVWLTWESIRVWRDRLAAAHAAEIVERDEELALAKLAATHEAEYADKMRARAEAAERDAREAAVLLREASSQIDCLDGDLQGVGGVGALQDTAEKIDTFLAAIATTEQADED